MPSGVYQPTTVSYEPPLGILGANSATHLRVFRKPRPQIALLLFALLALAAGVAMLASGMSDWLEAKEYLKNPTNDEIIANDELPLGILLGGLVMAGFGLIASGIYLKVANWRRNCVCPCPCMSKKQSLARQFQSQSGNGGGGGGSSGNQGIMALNPSTDPLVSHTQYAPVSELPSLRTEDEERRNLMPDSKDCLSSAEESDRMLEPDPRIVLRPMGHVDDS